MIFHGQFYMRRSAKKTTIEWARKYPACSKDVLVQQFSENINFKYTCFDRVVLKREL